jgi:hypothetical protein
MIFATLQKQRIQYNSIITLEIISTVLLIIFKFVSICMQLYQLCKMMRFFVSRRFEKILVKWNCCWKVLQWFRKTYATFFMVLVSGTLTHGFKPFWLWLRIRGENQLSVNDTAVQPTLSNIFTNDSKHCFFYAEIWLGCTLYSGVNGTAVTCISHAQRKSTRLVAPRYQWLREFRSHIQKGFNPGFIVPWLHPCRYNTRRRNIEINNWRK